MRKRIAAILVMTVAVVFVAWAVAAAQTVEVHSVLSGTVSAQGLTTTGATVREGDVLVMVDTIAGPAVAARATVDGKVASVLVQPGQRVRTGDVLVRLETH